MIVEALRGHVFAVSLSVCLLFFCPAPGSAASSAQSETVLAGCIRQAASGREWLEKTLWGLRDQEAGWLGAQIANTNGTHDLGLLQINSSWVPRLAKLTGRGEAEIRTWLVRDACFNVQAARWIFLSGLKASGDYWKAVGIYHSPTLWRQRRYALSVAGHLRRRFGQGRMDRHVQASSTASPISKR
ncbi:lytic transglycosylase domain-containing protein [Novosphingobium resinovorum]|uniref:lytic transglycosylase domain-containing protein n=1 Tax=Novosphingobium resinovorum TaxID=158500 RepID=UPI002E803FEA|nr:lytic transglycosylase domain-containing protein [Novosphingobium resinovorum]